MNLWLTVDFVAKRYGMLPSEFLIRGSSLDVECADIAVGYETYLHEKNRAMGEGKPPPPGAKYTTEQLQSMVDKVKKGNKVGGKTGKK